MIAIIIKFIFGFALLIKGADVLISGAASIARKYGVSTFVIGLTVVAFGTSAPELAISILASIKGSSGITMGNIIGSNISNTLLILGISAVIYPLAVKKATINKEMPFSLFAIAIVGILCNDHFIDGMSIDKLSRIDGLILILFFSIFIYYTFGISKTKENVLEKIQDEISDSPKEYGNYISLLMIVFGVAGLTVGGEWLVGGAIFIAGRLGMSEALIGLTIIALGTSLPELATSAVAAYRKNTDIAVGNIVGSNIFNLLWVLGLSSAINPINYDQALNLDLIVLFGVTLLTIFLIYIGKKNVIGRIEGGIMVLIYFIYIIFLITRG